MSSFILANEAKQGVFDVVSDPTCTVRVKDISVSDSATTGTGTLDLQGVTVDYPVTLLITGEDACSVTGSFTINTLDFPLREQVKAKDVNKDEIEVKFRGVFNKN
jgi:polyisoprenoid-binding protein YceI